MREDEFDNDDTPIEEELGLTMNKYEEYLCDIKASLEVMSGNLEKIEYSLDKISRHYTDREKSVLWSINHNTTVMRSWLGFISTIIFFVALIAVYLIVKS